MSVDAGLRYRRVPPLPNVPGHVLVVDAQRPRHYPEDVRIVVGEAQRLLGGELFVQQG
jgi:hypothetical protein